MDIFESSGVLLGWFLLFFWIFFCFCFSSCSFPGSVYALDLEYANPWLPCFS